MNVGPWLKPERRRRPGHVEPDLRKLPNQLNPLAGDAGSVKIPADWLSDCVGRNQHRRLFLRPEATATLAERTRHPVAIRLNLVHVGG
jgi:hypothetical protein